jgi:hypothetical protein
VLRASASGSYPSGVPQPASKAVHTVSQQEHLASIATDSQLASYAKVWNDPDNADLRQRREVPHALLPGDVVTIPVRDPLIYQRPTGKQHVFTVHLMPLILRLVVLNELERPIANEAGTLTSNGVDQDITTDGDGRFEAKIDNGTTSATLTLGTRTFCLSIGHLDPNDEASGQLGRLKALGYFDGEVPEATEFEKQRSDIEARMELAWELFQDANGLKLTGQGDDESVKKLKEVFGA